MQPPYVWNFSACGGGRSHGSGVETITHREFHRHPKRRGLRRSKHAVLDFCRGDARDARGAIDASTRRTQTDIPRVAIAGYGSPRRERWRCPRVRPESTPRAWVIPVEVGFAHAETIAFRVVPGRQVRDVSAPVTTGLDGAGRLVRAADELTRQSSCEHLVQVTDLTADPGASGLP